MAGFKSERWPDIDRNAGRLHVGIRTAATRRREVALQTLGNLTILSKALNAAQSNLAWKEKRPELMKHSLLPINQALHDKEIWEEDAILERGKMLFDRAVAIWKWG